MPIRKPWQPLAQASQLGGQLGVFELGDAAGDVVYIGVAQARESFGLRSAVAAALNGVHEAMNFRIELTSAYHTRYQELLMQHQALYGHLPAHNVSIPQLGRLHLE